MFKSTTIFSCAICTDPIDEFNNICRPSCKCQLWYHQNCLLEAYKDSRQKGKCLQCRESTSIWNWEGAMKKFWLPSKAYKEYYLKLYKQYLQKQQYTELTYLTELFFSKVQTYRDNLPNYLLLPVFDFSKYLVFDQQQSTDLLTNTLKENTNFRALVSPNLYRTEESVIVTKEVFNKRWMEFNYDILDNDFKWDNVVVAGGSLYRLLSPKLDYNITLNVSDIDLFIYGDSPMKRKNAVNRVLEYFRNKYRNNVFFVVHKNRNLVDVILRGISRRIQIICNNFSNIPEITDHFDFDYAQLCYFKGKLYATPATIRALKHQVCWQPKIGSIVRIHRLKKALSFYQSLIIDPRLNCHIDKSASEKECNNIIDLKISKLCEENKELHFTVHTNSKNLQQDIEFNKTNNYLYSGKINEYYPKWEENDIVVLQKLRDIIEKTNTLTKDKSLTYLITRDCRNLDDGEFLNFLEVKPMNESYDDDDDDHDDINMPELLP